MNTRQEMFDDLIRWPRLGMRSHALHRLKLWASLSTTLMTHIMNLILVPMNHEFVAPALERLGDTKSQSDMLFGICWKKHSHDPKRSESPNAELTTCGVLSVDRHGKREDSDTIVKVLIGMIHRLSRNSHAGLSMLYVSSR